MTEISYAPCLCGCPESQHWIYKIGGITTRPCSCGCPEYRPDYSKRI